jgi:hypothetical protein
VHINSTPNRSGAGRITRHPAGLSFQAEASRGLRGTRLLGIKRVDRSERSGSGSRKNGWAPGYADSTLRNKKEKDPARWGSWGGAIRNARVNFGALDRSYRCPRG